jgi:hypothetical protein
MPGDTRRLSIAGDPRTTLAYWLTSSRSKACQSPEARRVGEDVIANRLGGEANRPFQATHRRSIYSTPFDNGLIDVYTRDL